RGAPQRAIRAARRADGCERLRLRGDHPRTRGRRAGRAAGRSRTRGSACGDAGADPFAYVRAWAGAEHRRQLNMLIAEIILVALGALRANKLRSFLTMLGIVIGVSAVITMVALGRGAQNAVEDRIASLGTTLLTVQPGAARGMGGVASG